MFLHLENQYPLQVFYVTNGRSVELGEYEVMVIFDKGKESEVNCVIFFSEGGTTEKCVCPFFGAVEARYRSLGKSSWFH